MCYKMLQHFVITAFLLGKGMISVAGLHPLSDEFIHDINTKQNTWIAGRNFPIETPVEYLKSLSCVLTSVNSTKLPIKEHDKYFTGSLPETFDSREKWPNCPSLKEIRDQGACGSCWAIAAVEAMTDRICIHSNATRHVHLSTNDLISCCSDVFCTGCDGGMPSAAWLYWFNSGIVSGGEYNSSEGCRPYVIPPCDHYTRSGKRPPCSHKTTPTPACDKKCIQGYNVPYEKDLNRALEIYSVGGGNEEKIKAEIFEHGPVEVSFEVFEDFLSYKSGVYQHVSGESIGGHAVKMIGWGVENGVKYWLIANSWNADWGENGYFRILRGVNHCDIEIDVTGGTPNLTALYTPPLRY